MGFFNPKYLRYPINLLEKTKQNQNLNFFFFIILPACLHNQELESVPKQNYSHVEILFLGKDNDVIKTIS